MARYSPFREELRRAFHELRGADLSPARGAAAIALGLFVGSQPLFGLHTPIVLALCWWLRLDAVLGWAATNISNPLFAPALITAELEVGALLRTGAFVKPSSATVASLASAPLDLFVGGAIVGAAIAGVGFGVSWAGLTLRRRSSPRRGSPAAYALPAEAPPWVHAVERVAGRYAAVEGEGSVARGRSRFHQVRWRLVGDPIARRLAEADDGSLGLVAQLGAGRGELLIALIELGRATAGWGVELDADEVAIANAAARFGGGDGAAAPTGIDGRFVVGNVRETVIPEADTVLLIDGLRGLDPEAQNALVRRAAEAVRPGGRVVVRVVDTERGWRSGVTRVVDRVVAAVRGLGRGGARPRAAREIAALLEAAGFRCAIYPAWGRTPFSHVVVIGVRPSTG